MPGERKNLAKYGAKIPSAPKTGAKQAQGAEPAAPANPSTKPPPPAKKGGGKKR
ncbi:MAG TPA: hypothetical protein VGP22_04680 [Albitalea sp.]|jgi:hypothetical protein|nr:hypothetical protein [Albitalea sp.]